MLATILTIILITVSFFEEPKFIEYEPDLCKEL